MSRSRAAIDQLLPCRAKLASIDSRTRPPTAPLSDRGVAADVDKVPTAVVLSSATLSDAVRSRSTALSVRIRGRCAADEKAL